MSHVLAVAPERRQPVTLRELHVELTDQPLSIDEKLAIDVLADTGERVEDLEDWIAHRAPSVCGVSLDSEARFVRRDGAILGYLVEVIADAVS